MKLDLGSGHIRLKGWKRVDLDPEADPHYKLPIQGLEKHFKPNSIDALRAYHVLEHISPRECFSTIKSWWKILKYGCTIHIEVPDCLYAIEAFVDGKISYPEVDRIILGADQDATEWMVHRNIFTEPKLRRLLTVTGFVNITRDESCPPEVVNITAYKPKRGE